MSLRALVYNVILNVVAAVLVLGLLFPPPALAQSNSQPNSQWLIRHTEWTAEHEQGFSNFVAAIGESGCRNADQCFKSEANPYRHTNLRYGRFVADCADFPIQLRAYYAAKNGLPFSYARRVGHASTQDRGRNIRYSANGNVVVERVDVVAPNQYSVPLIMRVLLQIRTQTSSAMYRINPTINEQDGMFADTYPVAINRQSIRPGAVLYDPNGHVAIVYRVGDDGRVFFMDAHPGSSVTRGTFSSRFARGRPTMAGGIKQWRSQRLVGARFDAERGAYFGGTIEAQQALTSIPDFSLEQYTGTQSTNKDEWRSAQFVVGTETLDYHDFVRARLVVGDFRIDPLLEVTNMTRDICTDLQDRVEAVQVAITDGMSRRAAPARLPDNIYGTEEMNWETYSSPSRDARLRTGMREFYQRVEQMLQWRASRDARLVFSGSEREMATEMLRSFYTEAQNCTVTYTKTNGAPQTISFVDALDRAYGFSFDPYQCAERRWGATTAEELASCDDTATDTAWYHAEQVLRNQLERTYDTPMGWSLSELQALNPSTAGVGVLATDRPELDVEALLLDRSH